MSAEIEKAGLGMGNGLKADTAQAGVTEKHRSTTTVLPNGAQDPAETTSRKALRRIIWWLSDQWFLLALGLLIAIASQAQVPASQQALKSTVVSYVCVSLIFLFTGLTLSTRTLIANYSRWKLHLFVQVQCFLLVSAITFAVVSLCALDRAFMDPGLLIGLIFQGCVATTISSNVVMTRAAGGNVALTVVQSTIGNFLGPFVTPALLSMYTSTGAWYTQVLPKEQGGYTEIYRRVFKQLGLAIFLPLFVGQVVQNVFPDLTKRTVERYKLNKLGTVALLIIAWSMYDQAFRSRAFESFKASNMIFIVFGSIGFYCIFLGLCLFLGRIWLSKADTVSVMYCVPAKSPAVGVPLANVMFLGLSDQLESKIQMPMVIYQGLQILGGSLMLPILRSWVEREEKSRVSTPPDLEATEGGESTG